MLIHRNHKQYFFTKRRINEIPTQPTNVFNSYVKLKSEVKHLGLIYDKTLTLIEKAHKVLKIMYSLMNRKSTMSIYNKLLLYKVIIRPILVYDCPAYGNMAKCHFKKLQIF